MKAYTNLEQSKKLAEILPLESADMCYVMDYSAYDRIGKVEYNVQVDHYGCLIHQKDNIPCWSLAALLDIIPQEIFDGDYIIDITEGCNDRWVLNYDHIEHINHTYYGLTAGTDNLVDACYEMIIKLKERGLI